MIGRRKLLALEPYFGGSHRLFLETIARKADFSVEVVSLPAHSWKWRIRFAAPFFATILPASARYDCVLCSSMLDVAALRGIGPAWLKSTRLVTYFHENQFAYPVRKPDQRDVHFAVTNLTTAIASDLVLFNSTYNRQSFLTGAADLLTKLPDMQEGIDLTALAAKSAVLAPPLDFSDIDAVNSGSGRIDGEAPLLIWNHRWEHDKNPEFFFESLFFLQERGVPFRVALLGQSFREAPEIFQKARQRLQKQVVHFGYAPRDTYVQWLHAGAVVLSTALHEFFGISVIEAVRAGCRPVLPARLSYPELFHGNFLYKDEELIQALVAALTKGQLPKKQATGLTERFDCDSLLPEYEAALFG